MKTETLLDYDRAPTGTGYIVRRLEVRSEGLVDVERPGLGDQTLDAIDSDT